MIRQRRMMMKIWLKSKALCEVIAYPAYQPRFAECEKSEKNWRHLDKWIPSSSSDLGKEFNWK